MEPVSLLQLRKILMDMLCSHYKVNKRMFAKKVETESGMSPSDNDCKTVLRVSIKDAGGRIYFMAFVNSEDSLACAFMQSDHLPINVLGCV